MNRQILMAAAALVAWAGLQAASAQPAADEQTRSLIERLRPPDQLTRGIRMPGTDSGTATPAPQTEAPQTTAPQTTAPQTTAPAGVPAVSITVNFATGSASLSPQAAAALASLGRALASPELAPFRFAIEGHTDSAGDAELNRALSQRRAEAVRDFLVTRHAIAPARLTASGLGEGQLLVPTPDNTPEARNRRVQVVNLGG
jgi:OmpA-OmpF porin, OOP family